MSSLLGQQLGRYALVARLGQGGMAEVYEARDSKLGREVAIKVILPHFAADTHFLDRFLREARTVAKLEHPHILPIYDFGEHEGLPFLVMPLVRGGTLAGRLRGRPLPLALVVEWTRQLACALDAAHTAGVLHRDVKPANVLIGKEERLFLADFGIAKLADATTRLTQTGTAVGTPLYMAPEVAAEPKPAADPEPADPESPPAPEPAPSRPSPGAERPSFLPLQGDPKHYPKDLLGSRRSQALRDGTRRATEADFRAAVEIGELLSRGKIAFPAVEPIGAYGRGGLALLAGEASSSRILTEVLDNERFLRFWGPSVFTLLKRAKPASAADDWQLALGYGDPLATAGAEIDRLLAQKPGDMALRVGRVLVDRLDGEHRKVIEGASSIYAGLDRKYPEIVSFVAQTVADAHAALGELDPAFEWYRKAVDAGGPHRGAVAFRAALLAHENGLGEAGRHFAGVACESGVPAACRGERRGWRPFARPRSRRQE